MTLDRGLGGPIAVLDANVLYSASLRHLLIWLAITEAFDARWTETIQDEWTRSLLENRGEFDPRRIARTRQLMDAHIDDAIVTGYEPLVAGLTLPDMNDRHVLAAAIHCGATVIVTKNLADFPAGSLAPHGMAACAPADDTSVSDLRSFPSFAKERSPNSSADCSARAPAKRGVMVYAHDNTGVAERPLPRSASIWGGGDQSSTTGSAKYPFLVAMNLVNCIATAKRGIGGGLLAGRDSSDKESLQTSTAELIRAQVGEVRLAPDICQRTAR